MVDHALFGFVSWQADEQKHLRRSSHREVERELAAIEAEEARLRMMEAERIDLRRW